MSYLTQIELLYALPIGLIIACAIAIYYNRLNPMIAGIGILGGIVIAWAIAPYTALIMTPIHNAIFYGYSWTLLVYLGLLHIILIFIILGLFLRNLYISKGKRGWA